MIKFYTKKEWEIIRHRLEADDAMMEVFASDDEYSDQEMEVLKERIFLIKNRGQEKIDWNNHLDQSIMIEAINGSTFTACKMEAFINREIEGKEYVNWKKVFYAAKKKTTQNIFQSINLA